MKTGIGTSAYTENGFTDFKQMRADGFDCADEQLLCDTNGEVYSCGEERFSEILKKRLDDAKSNGITFSQVHGPWPVCDTTPEKRCCVSVVIALVVVYVRQNYSNVKILLYTP